MIVLNKWSLLSDHKIGKFDFRGYYFFEKQYRVKFNTIHVSKEWMVQRIISIPYSRAIGSFINAIVCTPTNISHEVSVSCYMVNLGKFYWQGENGYFDIYEALQKLVWSMTKVVVSVLVSLSILNQIMLVVWIRDLWQVIFSLSGSVISRKATCLYFLCGFSCILFVYMGARYVFNDISNNYQKMTLQSTVALWTTKAVYIATTEAVKEALWLRGLVNDLALQQDVTSLLQ